MENRLIFDFLRNHYKLKGMLSFKESQDSWSSFELTSNFKSIDIQTKIITQEEFSTVYSIQKSQLIIHSLQIACFVSGIALFFLPKEMSLWNTIYFFLLTGIVFFWGTNYFLKQKKIQNYLYFKPLTFKPKLSLKWVVATDFTDDFLKEAIYNLCTHQELGLVYHSDKEGFTNSINPIKATTNYTEEDSRSGVRILVWFLVLIPSFYFFSHKTNQINRIKESNERAIDPNVKYAPIDSKD